MEEITVLLRLWGAGDLAARDRVMELVYQEMRSIARALMRNERPGHMLDTTALAHEAYLRLADQRAMDWQSRAHFYGAAATAMRRILVDEARKRLSAKRGADAATETIEDALSISHKSDLDVVALHIALEELAKFDPERTRVVELRYMLGMSIEEAAEILGRSTQSVNRDWVVARAWLARQLGSGRKGEG
jgi:RNA polymerase sigma factor (TIGR02999 family)